MLRSFRKWPAMAATGSIPAEMVSVMGPVSKWEIKVKSLDSRCTFVNEIMGINLVRQMFPQLLDFQGDAVLQLVEPGLYRKGWRKTDGT